MANAKLSSNCHLSKPFNDCKEYIVYPCQGSSWLDKVDDLIQVYETVEKLVLNPEEFLKQTEETTTTAGEFKRRFKRLSLNFGSKDKNQKKSEIDTNCENNSPANNLLVFLTESVNYFCNSLFCKCTS